MKTLHDIRNRIAEELRDLYEAFYAAQERIEDSEFIETTRNRIKSIGPKNPRLVKYEPRVS
jgi:hypothetical protein